MHLLLFLERSKSAKGKSQQYQAPQQTPIKADNSVKNNGSLSVADPMTKKKSAAIFVNMGRGFMKKKNH